jgi:membrane dipeptidase
MESVQSAEETVQDLLLKKAQPVADLHCDLLWYLSLDPSRTPHDAVVRCSLSQLKKGNVRIQTLPIYAETLPGSQKSGLAQAEVFKALSKRYPDDIEPVRFADQLEQGVPEGKIGILPAVENASAVCGEEEELDAALERLTALQRRIGKLLYVSLTWNTENRFGGGALTRVGLKDDGKRMIDYLVHKGIAIDFSHASDDLAYGILEYTAKEGMDPIVMASHSNMRKVVGMPRNLPDDLAKEIIKRGGLIGLNFIRFLVGSESTDNFCRQLEHLIGLGGAASACLGADFFYTEDVRPVFHKPAEVLFFPEVGNAGTYGYVIDLWRKRLGITEEMVSNICYTNFIRFVKARI